LINLGLAFLGKGDYAEAERFFKQSLDSSRRNKSRRREAESLLNLGSVYIQQLRTNEGLPLVEQSLEIFKQGNYRKDISICLTLIGRANRQKGDYEAALKALQLKLGMAQSSGDQLRSALAYGEIGAVLIEQENYVEALKQYDASLAINRAFVNRQNMAYNQHNRGNILWRLGRYEDARRALAESLELASLGSYQALQAEIQLSYAQIALSERHFADAKSSAEQALKMAGTQYQNVAVEAKYTLGLAQTFSGSALQGRSLCDVAVQMAKGMGDAALQSRAMLALAEASLESGDAETALSTATAAKARFAQAGQRESEWRAEVIAARANQRRGNQQASQELLTRASSTLTQLQQRWGDDAFAQYLARPDIQNLRKQLG
jgi:tetratricopeptide (TPR) repeat protein